mmetsp:Transcript_8054/g.24837  ORF Transcript_8054/g.24837 Transcript_8054/m.24837 type:complete len:168 (+) Transcript_8054:131-634(+)
MKRAATKAERKAKKAKHDAEEVEWTVATEQAVAEASEMLPRLRKVVVVGTNAVSRRLEKRLMRFVVLANDMSGQSHLLEMARLCQVPLTVLPTGSSEPLARALSVKRVSAFGIPKTDTGPEDALSLAMEDFCAWIYRWQSSPTDAHRSRLDGMRLAFQSPKPPSRKA